MPPGRPGTRTARPWRYVLEAVLLWIGLGAVLLYVYQVAEANWLAELPPDKLPMARLIRSVAISVTATVVTAVYVIWRAVPSLRRTLSDEADAQDDELGARRRLGDWLVSLRWVALLVLAPVVVLSSTGGFLPESSGMPMWAAVGALFLLNTTLTLLDRRLRTTPAVVIGQMVADMLVLGWLVHHAGGLANPFAGIFTFHAVLAGIVLTPEHARRVIALFTAFVLGLTAVEALGVLPPGCVFGLDGVCYAPDALHLLASGMGVAILVAGCGMFVVALIGAVRRERDRLQGARSELAEEREKLRSVIDCMADAVVFADPQGSIRILNHAALGLWPDGPPANRDLRVCHNPATWQRLLDKLANPSDHEEHPMLEVAGRSYEPTYARVLDEHGQLGGVVMVARDVTERLEAQNWRMREERMAVVGKLAAALAHELNNPLGSIALFTQHALKKLPADDPLNEHLQTVLRNANLCSKHVRDLLSYARQRPPERSRLDPRELVTDVARTLEPKAESSHVTVDTRVGADAPGALVADADQLRQVLMNLGLNAIEAMTDGGALALVVERDGPNGMCFEVRDTGPGIEEEDQERIFSAFHTTKAEGTGLGLAVASDIARAHGGSIDVQSHPGQGSTFTVRLPLGEAAETTEAAE